jgi:glycosyltransferase involved in cell wall biosynthesis
MVVRVVVCQRVCPEYNVPLFERLSRRYDIEFVLSRFGLEYVFFFNPERLAGIRTRALRPPPFPLLPFSSRVLNKLSFWTHIAVLSRQLAAVLRRGRYDVVVGGDFGRFECVMACLVARWQRRPFVLWSETWHWPLTWRDRLRVPLVRWMIRRSAALIAGGTRAADTLRALGAGPRPIFIAYHTPVSVAAADRAPGPERYVLFVGRLEERKGVEYLLEAFARVHADHPGLRLKILGRGERRDRLVRRAAELGLAAAVDWVGWVDHAAIDPYYRACAVCVLPSIFTAEGGYEPFATVVLEAMAWGAPVITTVACGAAWDVLEDGVNGRVVPDRDAGALAEALADVLDDPDRAEAMGRRARETVRTRFNVDRMAERFAEALDWVGATALGAGAGR